MGWSRNRRKSPDALALRPERAEPIPEARPRSVSAPRDSRPPTIVPPGESRYHKAGGLRARLAAVAADGEDIHVTIDLTELRQRTVR